MLAEITHTVVSFCQHTDSTGATFVKGYAESIEETTRVTYTGRNTDNMEIC